MNWPVINCIDDVLPHIKDKPEFSVSKREWGTAIDYNYAGPTTFDNPMAMECRGLKFDRDGTLIARPLHKFFNIGEKSHTQIGELPWDQAHHILEKLDGSMVHACMVDHKLLWMTRAGVSDVAKKAAERVTGKIAKCARDMIAIGATAIFEWVSPENRIVVKYERDELVLTAVRDLNGNYWAMDAVTGLARGYGIPCVRIHGNVTDAVAFMESARKLQDAEGYVVRWADGQMVKVKADAYVQMHKAKDGLSWEKDVIALVLNNGVDDVLPLLAPDDRAALEHYNTQLRALIQVAADELTYLVTQAKSTLGGDRKRFALEVVPLIKRPIRHVAYYIWEGRDPLAELTKCLLGFTKSSTAVDEIRCILGDLKWDRRFFMEPT